LDNGHAIGRGYLENTVHFDERDDKATPNGDASANVAATCAAGGYGNTVAVGEGENFRDLSGGTGKGDSGGKGGSHPSVGGVGLKGGGFEADDTFWKEAGEGAEV
jgi:hypothetical protein